MGMFLFTIGLLGGIGFLIASIVFAIKKVPKKKQWGATIGVIICAVLFISGTVMTQPSEPAQAAEQSKSSSAQSNQTSAKNEVSSEPSITDGATKVDYKTLYKDYEDNAISADKKYRDKKLILTGTIANIDRDIGQSPYITFNVDQYGAQSIKMSFNDDDVVASLKKGQKVTVVGTCGGTFASAIVVMGNCSIVK